MLVPAALLWCFLLPAPTLAQAPAQTPTHPAAAPAKQQPARHATPVEPKSPPLTAAELEQVLNTALHAPPFAADQLKAAIQGDAITLTGMVREAEDKGIATELARSAAAKARWTGTHVFNQATVELVSH